ncbi:hypothetical protein BC834DRAFT_1021985, partial [Gloeopeniophorella convolvens]
KPLENVLSFFAPSLPAAVFEHGLPALAPFLGRTFEDLAKVAKYLTIVSDAIAFENARFTDYIVDPDVFGLPWLVVLLLNGRGMASAGMRLFIMF